MADRIDDAHTRITEVVKSMHSVRQLANATSREQGEFAIEIRSRIDMLQSQGEERECAIDSLLKRVKAVEKSSRIRDIRDQSFYSLIKLVGVLGGVILAGIAIWHEIELWLK